MSLTIFNKMNKIIGITLIVAVTFFNITFVTNANGNMDLASLIEQSFAQPEEVRIDDWGWVEPEVDITRIPNENGCEDVIEITTTYCYGDGDKICIDGGPSMDEYEDCL